MPSLRPPVPCRTITAGRRFGGPASAAVRPGTRCIASVLKVNSSHAIRALQHQCGDGRGGGNPRAIDKVQERTSGRLVERRLGGCRGETSEGEQPIRQPGRNTVGFTGRSARSCLA